jgi:ATP-binding cassette subfamily B protein
MDKILVLDSGHVEEEGTHSDLLRAKGMYWHIFRKQLVERKVEKE